MKCIRLWKKLYCQQCYCKRQEKRQYWIKYKIRIFKRSTEPEPEHRTIKKSNPLILKNYTIRVSQQTVIQCRREKIKQLLFDNWPSRLGSQPSAIFSQKGRPQLPLKIYEFFCLYSLTSKWIITGGARGRKRISLFSSYQLSDRNTPSSFLKE